jgi:hypothetical protein
MYERQLYVLSGRLVLLAHQTLSIAFITTSSYCPFCSVATTISTNPHSKISIVTMLAIDPATPKVQTDSRIAWEVAPKTVPLSTAELVMTAAEVVKRFAEVGVQTS